MSPEMPLTSNSMPVTDAKRRLGLVHIAFTRRLPLLLQFCRFGMAGAVGFVFDTGTVYALRSAVGVYAAGIAAYVVAATVTWLLNRLWAFRGRGGGPLHRQWALFLAANLLGFVLNRGTFALLIMFFAICKANPVIAIAAGMIASMFVNFFMMKKLVFR